MSKQRCEVSQLVSWYREFLDNGKSAAFVSCVATRYGLSTLARLTQSSDHESRRASVLALGMLGDRTSIPALGVCLRDTDRCVRLVAEISFSDVCRREFGDTARRQLDIARRHLDGERFEKADQILDAITTAWPEFGDAWYLRAVTRYCQQDFIQAIGLARRTVGFNKFHFAAHALEARTWLDLDTPSRALASFRRSFVINPSQTVVQSYIDVLSRQVRASEK